MSLLRGLALAGAVGGAVAAGLAGGVAAERTKVRGPRSRPDAVAAEPFGALPADRAHRVRADDGVELYVEEVGALDAPLTIVFSHGYTLEMASWHYQRRDLADLGRLVLWDQRSHGRSGRSDAAHCTIDQLGSDLERVLAACAPTGPVVLVGHSMGGMTVMALAERCPQLFASGGQVVGVALVATSAGRLAEVTLGLPRLAGRVARRVVPRAWVGMGARAAFVDTRRERGKGNDLSYAVTRRLSFGSNDVSPALVDLMERMIAQTSTEVIAAFAPAFLSHDKLQALGALRGTSVLVLVGDADVLTPTDHAHAIADALPDAESVVLPGAGHMVMLERPQLVSLWLRTLVARALARAVAEGVPAT